MRKAKRYADGGATIVLGGQQAPNMDPTLTTSGGGAGMYPFGGGGGSGGLSNNTTTNVSVGGQQVPLEQPMFKKGGKVSSARRNVDGCAQRGKTRGRMV